MSELLFTILIILIASIIHSTAGFGYSIISMMILPIYFSVPESIIIKTISGLIVISFLALKYRKHINLKLLIWPLILSVPGSIIGIKYVSSIDNNFMMKILGVSLVTLAIYFYFFKDKVKIPANKWTALITGGISGAMGGLLGVPGPPIVLYYSVALKKKEVYIATLQTFFIINDIVRMIFIAGEVSLSADLIKVLPISMVTALLGVFIGNKIFNRLSSKVLHLVIYILMGLSGIYYIFS